MRERERDIEKEKKKERDGDRYIAYSQTTLHAKDTEEEEYSKLRKPQYR